jgi:uncharacterized protein DUF1554
MTRSTVFATFLAATAIIAGGCSSDDDNAETTGAPLTPADGTSFFVTSKTNTTGNLGGISGADATCDQLATAAGQGNKVWKAYLSTTTENAKDRIGQGPWFNAKGAMVAANLTALHSTLTGKADLLIDEKGNAIDGQWNSAMTVQHDILTGSAPDGTLAPLDPMGRSSNCKDWTSAGTDAVAQVGHSDGMGPMMSMATSPTNYTSWNSVHASQDCSDTAPRGGAGRFYCFATGKK